MTVPAESTEASSPFASGAVVWRPSSAYLSRSRLLRFMAAQGIATLDELQRRSVNEPEWFWDAVVRDLDLNFFEPYRQVLDLTRGAPWASWFVGGRYNYVHNALDRHALGATAHRLAVIWEGEEGDVRQLTYAELAGETERLALALKQLGIEKGDRVGVFMPMVPEVVVATLACGKIGAIFIPIFSGYAAPAVATRLRDAGARVLITANGFPRRGKVVPMGTTALQAAEQAPTIEHVVVVRRVADQSMPADPRLRWWDELRAVAAEPCPTERTAADDPYMLIYTSGTTGRPKGAVHVNAGFPIKATQDLAHCFDLQNDDRLFWLTDIGWMMGPWAIQGGLTLGATVCLYDGAPDYPEPDRLWRLVARHRPTILGVAPTSIRSMMTHGDAWVRRHDLSSVRVFGSTGEPWNVAPWRWLFEVVGRSRRPIINYSGGTEISGGIVGGFTISPLKPCSFAGPIPGMDADVVDEQGQSVRGAVGELVIRRPWVGMTHGFWQDADRYLDTYWSRWPDVWRHGDWALVDGDGAWYILGRSDDTIKVAGKRVGPAEVESAAVAHAAVAEAVAIGAPHPVKGEALIVLIVVRPDREESEALRADVRSAITSQLGPALRPEAIRFVGELPRTRNAKVLRRVARAAYVGAADLGDLSALENPSAIEAIRQSR